MPPTLTGGEHALSYESMSLDREQYRNQKVLILGKGNAAFETAWHLMPVAAEIRMLSRHAAKMAAHTHYVGDLRVVNDEALGAYQLKSLVSLLETDAQVANTTQASRIEYDPAGLMGSPYKFAYTYERRVDEGADPALYRKRGPVLYDNIILCTGFEIDQSPFSGNVRPTIDAKGKYAVLGPTYGPGRPGVVKRP